MKRAVVSLIVIVAVVRIAATYRVFSQTHDEPVHVAAGLEWLTSERYELNPEHPPLARIGFALAAYLEGAPLPDGADGWARGTELLYRNDRYRRNLFVARAANLPFFLLALFAVYAWTKRLFDETTAIVAAALYSMLPPILAHAGLATTDMPAAAMVVAALFALDVWLGEPTLRRAIFLGIATGAGVLAKFSFVVFFAAGALVLVIARRGRMRWRHIPLIAIVAWLLVWSGYKFSVSTLNEARLAVLPRESLGYQAARFASFAGYEWVRPDLVVRYYDFAHAAAARGVSGVDFVDWAKAAGYPSPLAGRSGRDTVAGGPPLPPLPLADRALEPFRRVWQFVVVRVPLPAAEAIAGIEIVRHHSEAGHPAFLLGRYSNRGWWYYFPVVLFFKTPLAFFLLAIAGVGRLRRHAIAYIPLLMLAVAMMSRINIGVRHVLPLYPLLAIAAAVAAMALWRRSRVLALVAGSWLFVATAIAHPDSLPYFNELARHPETIALDSNLDWGQDLLRLEDVVRRERIDHLYIAYFGTADWRRHKLNAEELPRDRRVEGWIAVSEMHLAFGGPHNRGDFHWLREYEPVRSVGKSIRLYRISQRDRGLAP